MTFNINNNFSNFISSIIGKDNDGKEFEKFVKWFLKNDSQWKTQIKKIWLWDEFPQRWGRDKGIDLVFRHNSGELWAVQAKCYNEDYYISKPDIDTFLSESGRKLIKKRLLISTTDKIGKNAKDVLKSQEKSVTLFLKNDFEKSLIKFPNSFKDLHKSTFKKKPKPYKYQSKAINDVANGFKKDQRGQLLMACGTGKTFTSMWIKEKIKSKLTLVLVPSLNLLSQTTWDWAYATNKKIDILCVCSDISVGKNDDHLIEELIDVSFPVENDPKKIGKFINKKGDKVLFCTYQSSHLIQQIQKNKKVKNFDLLIADEAHRCASAEHDSNYFTIVLNDKKIRAKNRLFLTATPRTYESNIKKIAAERGIVVHGMDDEKIFGKVFHSLTFAEAINHNPPLLSPYQIVIIGVEDPEVEKIITNRELVKFKATETFTDAERLATIISFLKSVRDYKLKNVISFHSRVKRAEKFSNHLTQIKTKLTDNYIKRIKLSSDFVSGTMPTFERKKKLDQLKNVKKNETRILANARCLSEGVDVPALDGIAFIDPKNSQIDIIQAIGRVIRLSKNKKIGTIVLPVFLNKNDDPDKILETSSYKKIWWVINALKSHDSNLVDELDKIRTNLGKKKQSPDGPVLPPEIILDIPRTVDEKFFKAFKTRIIEKSTQSWFFWYGLLLSYVKKFNTSRVSVDYITDEKHKLGQWVSSQRDKDTRKRLDKKKIDLLQALPKWSWDVRADNFEEMFVYLKDYIEEFGNSKLHKDYENKNGIALGKWVSALRDRHKMDTAFNRTNEYKNRVKRLEKLAGWSWDVEGDRWDEGFNHLKDYVEKFGTAVVEKKYVNEAGFKLGQWVYNRQRHRNNKKFDKDKKKLLEQLPGWIWSNQAEAWDKGLNELKKHVKDTGDANISSTFVTEEEFKLGEWVRGKRRAKKTLSKEKKDILESLPGWSWTTTARKENENRRFNQGVVEIEKYINEFNHCMVPNTYEAKDKFKLGIWVSNIRVKYKKNKLDKTKEKTLSNIKGWMWAVRTEIWEKNFQKLNDYVSKFGDAMVKISYESEDGFKLGEWVHNQRRSINLGSKNPKIINRHSKLQKLKGWTNDVFDEIWNQNFEALLKYLKKFGHASPPKRYINPNKIALGNWVVNIRQDKKDVASGRRKKYVKLDEKKIKELEKLTGWKWNPRNLKFST